MKKSFTFNSQNVLRIGISLVMIWFGTQQLMSPENWVTFLPGWISNLPLSQVTFVMINGLSEVVLGLLLAFNIWRKVVAALLALHMLGIIFSLGYSAIAVRDFAIFVALVAIFLEKEVGEN